MASTLGKQQLHSHDFKKGYVGNAICRFKIPRREITTMMKVPLLWGGADGHQECLHEEFSGAKTTYVNQGGSAIDSTSALLNNSFAKVTP